MKYLDYFLKLFFPEVCPLCKKTLKFKESYCPDCKAEELLLSLNCCESCGKERENCACQSNFTVPLSHFTAVFIYDGIIRARLLSFKFYGERRLYGFFGDRLAERVATAYASVDFDLVTFVPSSKKAMKERGYNPASLIAKRTAEKLFLPLEELLVKSKETESQHKLSAKDRLVNISGSVSIKNEKAIKGKTILLCDDIRTTGATLKECSEALLSAGARDVYCAAVAITSATDNFNS